MSFYFENNIINLKDVMDKFNPIKTTGQHRIVLWIYTARVMSNNSFRRGGVQERHAFPKF